jgi:hypothetical protein
MYLYSVPQFYKNILLYRRLMILFLQTLEQYNVLSFTFYQLNLFFLSIHNRNTDVLSDFTCFVSVFWHAVWHSHKQCMPTLCPRNAAYRFCNQVININSLIFYNLFLNIDNKSLEKVSFITMTQARVDVSSIIDLL